MRILSGWNSSKLIEAWSIEAWCEGCEDCQGCVLGSFCGVLDRWDVFVGLCLVLGWFRHSLVRVLRGPWKLLGGLGGSWRALGWAMGVFEGP